MKSLKSEASRLLRQFKGDRYVFGLGCLDQLGSAASELGERVTLVAEALDQPWARGLHDRVQAILTAAGLRLAGDPVSGPRPNAPVEDVLRLAGVIAEQSPDVVVAVGGGSCVDAAKAAVAYHALGEKHPELNDYFGVGQVSKMLDEDDATLLPVLACQTAASSGAHLTKYSNVTNIETGQKMLIVDEAVVPPKALFDYETTCTMPRSLTMDGGLDGVAHCLEVLFGIPEDRLAEVRPVSLLGIELIVNELRAACADPENKTAREALGLGTDLGGYAIMIGGTNGAHLTSFSLVDILSHGRACALMNPYYTVFFAPAIPERIRLVGEIYKKAGYTSADLDSLTRGDLGRAVADAMLAQSVEIGFPTTLREVEGFSDEHITRALTAAKNPKLDSKLKNMPVSLSAELVDDYMAPVLEAAKQGDFNLIKHL
jgi:alcohol dehydrogenase class IV